MESYYFHITQKIDKLRKPAVKPGLFKELISKEFWIANFAEMLGTFMFHFAGIASVTYWDAHARDMDAAILRISLAFGIAIAGVIEIVGPVSGAHLNPAVSIAFAVSRHISPLRSLLYVISQCIGAIASSAFLYGITPAKYAKKLGGNAFNPETTVWSAFGVEIFCTFFLMTVIYGCTNSRRSANGLPSLIIGLTVAGMQLSATTYSSCSMNPARSLGPAIFSYDDIWPYHWVFWAGPIAGSVVSALVYTYILDPYRSVPTIEDVLVKIEESNGHYLDNHLLDKKTNLDTNEINEMSKL